MLSPTLFELTRDSESVYNEVQPVTQPIGAKVNILAIVWGRQKIRDPKARNYIYSQAESGNGLIHWTNENVEGDPGFGYEKTGYVYYTIGQS